MLFNAKVIVLLSLIYLPLNCVNPQQLAACFENIHDLSFAIKHKGLKFATQTQGSGRFDCFLRLCHELIAIQAITPETATQEALSQKFFQTFGFADNEFGRQLLKYLFEALETLILEPDKKGHCFTVEPCANAFWIALDVGTKIIVDQKPADLDVLCPVGLLQRDFLIITKSGQTSFQAWQEFCQTYATAISQAIDAANIARSSVPKTPLESTEEETKASAQAAPSLEDGLKEEGDVASEKNSYLDQKSV